MVEWNLLTAMVIVAIAAGYSGIVVPSDNLLEAALVKRKSVHQVKTLTQVIDISEIYLNSDGKNRPGRSV